MENLMAKTQEKVWEFESSSSSKTYQTILYTDGYTSCNCPGWTRRAQRVCKHTNMVKMGTADQNCVACDDLLKNTPKKPVFESQPEVKVAPKKKKIKKAKAKKHVLEDDAPAVARKLQL